MQRAEPINQAARMHGLAGLFIASFCCCTATLQLRISATFFCALPTQRRQLVLQFWQAPS